MVSLKQIFTDCQRSTASHPKLLKQLVALHNKNDLDAFVDSFTNLLKRSLIHGDKQPAVERTLNFVAKFATMKKVDSNNKENAEGEDEEEDEDDAAGMFLVRLIEFLLNSHEANSQAVRFRVCQLINKILNNMGEEAVIDDELYSNIYDTMLQRLQDKVASVRVQAVLALARLQDPKNKECPVIKAYRYHLSMDPNHDVRRAVLTSIAITFQTLPDVLERTRDVNDVVRREAFKMLAQKVHIRSLTIAQRVRLISEGLKDRCESVRKTVEKCLIQSWLRMVNSNVLDLLSCLDVEASVAEAELALKTLFRDNDFNDMAENFGLDKTKRIIEYSTLRPESALYWRCFTQHLRDEGMEEALDTIIPELTEFSSYVHDYATMELEATEDAQEMAVLCMEREFVMTQLITMAMLYDLSDEVGRRSLDKLVRTLLMNDKTEETLVKGLVEVFGKLHPPTTRVNQLAEIISEIREPATKSVVIQPVSDEEKRRKKIQAAKIKVRMNQIREEIEECVRGLEFGKAQLLKEELEELEIDLSLISLDDITTEEVPVMEERTDPTTLSKCLMIVCCMIENPDISAMTPTLYSLNENLVLPCLRSEDPAVRNQGVKALGLLCLISSDLAKQHLVLFLQISRIDIEQVQLTALHCVIDLLLLYGLEDFTEAAEDINECNDVSLNDSSIKDTKEEDEEGECGVIISALCQMMESENVEVRTHAAEGLCKLLLASRITSSKLLSRLILMWYNPATEDDSLLRHMLGVFFPLYASFGGANQESLCVAVLPTLQTLFNAPSRSPLADVDVTDVANFLISITNPTFASGDSSEQVNTHDTLVFTLCTEILADPNSSWTKVLVRCLNHLNLTPTNYSTLRQVKVLSEKMLKKVRERVCQNGLERFNSTILSLLRDAPDPVPDQEETEKEEENKSIIPDGSLIETTIMRKKRMLFNQTHSDLEHVSSEAESDVECSPSKCPATEIESSKAENDGGDRVGSPKLTSTQKDNEEVEYNSRLNDANEEASDGDAELELSPIVSGPMKVKFNQKRTKKQRSPEPRESSEEEEKTPSKVPRTVRHNVRYAPAASGKHIRRRTKQQSVESQESSEGEKAVPSKVPRKKSLTDDNTDSPENEASATPTVFSKDATAEERSSVESTCETPLPITSERADENRDTEETVTDSGVRKSSRKSSKDIEKSISNAETLRVRSSARKLTLSHSVTTSKESSTPSTSGTSSESVLGEESPNGKRRGRPGRKISVTQESSSAGENSEIHSKISVNPDSSLSNIDKRPTSSAVKNSKKETPTRKSDTRNKSNAEVVDNSLGTSESQRSTRSSSSSVTKSSRKLPISSNVSSDLGGASTVRRSNRASRTLVSSQSSASSPFSSRASDSDATPFRRSGRLQAGSKSSDSDSETPVKRPTSRPVRKKRAVKK